MFRAVACSPPDPLVRFWAMTLQLYNTLTNREEDFTPLDPAGKRVTFYSCGPTVYDYAHIGNFRSFLVADVLRRTLELLGYDVIHVMNITDVGHMTDDETADGGGEDKMQLAARRMAEAKKSGELPPGVDIDPGDPYAIADFYADAFLEDARSLGLKVAIEQAEHPELMPRPTRYIEPMIELVQTLLTRDHAYVADDGAVYFDVQSFPDYGQLSGNTLEALRSGEGGRVCEIAQAVKKHPADFLLWKPDPKHIMKWPSPWGEGFPGWHLECSVMAMSLLAGDTGGVIDLHSGGEDNLFPHHECEIAQARGATGASHFARCWLHGRHLIVEGEKMSKSKGNFFTVRDILAKGASPAALRLELIRTHYRSNANFTFQGLKDSQRQIDRWTRLRDWLQTHKNVPTTGLGPLRSALDQFSTALADDLNIAGAIGALNEAVSQYDVSAKPQAAADGDATLADELEALLKMNSVLGVLDLEHEASLDAGDVDVALIETKIAERTEARKAKNWARADEIRDELLAMGIAIKDGPQGTTWSRVVQ
jgi:cysteinyl-tRNA synthetase